MRRHLLPVTLAAFAALALPSGAFAALDGELRGERFRVTGDAADDRVAAVANGTDVVFDFGIDGTIDRTIPMGTITGVDVELGGGKDAFSGTGNLASEQWSVNGGPGDDTLLGTNGVDSLTGGSGADFIDGQQAIDTTAGGTGADVVQWDPGDASETVDGGGDADRDTLVFNGSNAAEIYTITDSGTDVRFTRNLATITMTLDRVDVIDLKTLGGVDSVTSGGVADRTHLRIDAGADADTVTTGSGDDHITGGSEADTIDAGSGGDRVFAGAGPDQVFGREGDDGIEGGEGVDAINGGGGADGCTDAADIIADCESTTLPPDIQQRPFPHPLEPEEPVEPTDPGPTDPGPTDPGPSDPGGEQPAPVAGFAIDGARTSRRGLKITLEGTAAEAVEVEVEASETVKRRGRSGRRRVAYAPASASVPAGASVTVRLRAPKRHHAILAAAAKRRAAATVTNVTNGLSETEEVRSGR